MEGGIPGRDWGEESADKEGELELVRLGGGMKGGGEGGVNGCWNPGCKAGPGNRKSLLHPSSLSLWMAGMTLGLASSKGNDCGLGWEGWQGGGSHSSQGPCANSRVGPPLGLICPYSVHLSGCLEHQRLVPTPLLPWGSSDRPQG